MTGDTAPSSTYSTSIHKSQSICIKMYDQSYPESTNHWDFILWSGLREDKVLVGYLKSARDELLKPTSNRFLPEIQENEFGDSLISFTGVIREEIRG